MNVLITGGTGLIGIALTKQLEKSGYTVFHMSRFAKSNCSNKIFLWDINKNLIDPKALRADYIIHLAGANVGDSRWSASRKKEILESRTKSTELIYRALKEEGLKPKAFISASGISIYNQNSKTTHSEGSTDLGNDFLADVTKQWEAGVDKITELGIRTVKIRTGIVLSTKGGALPKLVNPIKAFVGAPLGSGQQQMPWIHINDMIKMYQFAMENDTVSGAYNGVANEGETNEIITQKIAKVLNRKIRLPNVPSFALKLLLGEMANIALEGTKISNQKIKKQGFTFEFEDFENAFKNLQKNKN